jgi:energy-coupling factor transporter ATP-binding protein EcfA2
MRLMGTLYGLTNPERIDDLLQAGDLSACADQLVYHLPQHLSRVLNLLVALLPQPDLLLIDDVTQGLSLPASRQLCRILHEEQRRHPRTILYTTSNLQTAQTLGGEVWLFDGTTVRAQWVPGTAPTEVLKTAAYRITLNTSRAAEMFCTGLATQPDFVRTYRQLDARTVQVFVDHPSRLLWLLQLAGRALLDFQALPQEIDLALIQPLAGDVALRSSAYTDGAINLNQLLPLELVVKNRSVPWVAIAQLAQVEWKTHFRQFWKAGNVLFSSLLLLSLLLVALQVFGAERWMTWGPMLLLFSSGIGLGFATESLSRLSNVAEGETLFQSARSIGPDRPVSLLALYDLSKIGRRNVLLGLISGQWLILLSHTLVFLLIWTSALMMLTPDPTWIIVSVLYWLLLTIDSLAVAVIASGLVHRPGWGRWAGWGSGLVILAVAILMTSNQPLLWLWPYTGFTVALTQLLTESSSALAAFGAGVLGTIFLWSLALYSFIRRRSVWPLNTSAEK